LTNQEFIVKRLLASLAVCTLIAAPVWAGTKTVTLAVPGMTCAACPFTVKAALAKVAGVTRTDVKFEAREAKVTFDDAKTNLLALMKATGDAGYPSTLKN